MGLFDDTSGIDWGMMGTGFPTPALQPNFTDRFNGGGPPPVAPPLGQTMGAMAPMAGQSPISPEALAASAAARGIPPPAKDLTPDVINPGDPHRLPPQAATDAWRNSVDGTGDVGAALTGQGGTPGPMDITSDAQKAGVAAPAGATKPEDKLGGLAAALRGTKMPADPVQQKISSPSAPRPTTQIKGGDLMALLQALNATPGASGLKLPSTLGEAIRK